MLINLSSKPLGYELARWVAYVDENSARKHPVAEQIPRVAPHIFKLIVDQPFCNVDCCHFGSFPPCKVLLTSVGKVHCCAAATKNFYCGSVDAPEVVGGYPVFANVLSGIL